jgi:mannose-6-phosphate isomerase-like protein (cupin superfamily)
MSYPEPTYLGETGEASAWYRPANTPAELPRRGGGAAHYLATGAPRPSGPDPHFHRSISESFFVLDGTVRLYDGRTWRDATAGDFLFVPEGGVHAFRNESGERASMLILFAPGAPREGYFEGLAGLDGRSEQEKAEFYLRHDTFWLG